MSELKQSKTEWTSDNWHKVCGEFTFHPNFRYQMRDKKKDGRIVWNVKVPDLENAWWEPQFEFAYDIWTSIIVSKGAVNQRGEHSVGLFAALYTEDQWHSKTTMRVTPLAKVRPVEGPSYSFRGTFPTEKRIECDSGKYYVEWAIRRIENDDTRDRQGDGGPEGVIVWDSDAAEIKRRIAINQNVYG
ncbi:hypothetical protein ACWC2K_31455 [Streptomyces chattanoogensis]